MENIKVGDILLDKWGYSMTLNSFYQVTRLTEKSVYGREIKNQIIDGGGHYGNETAVPNTFIEGDRGIERRFTPKGGYFSYSYSQGSRHTAHKWDGEPTNYNHMD